MTSVLEPVTLDGELMLPEPCGLQPVWLSSSARRKVLRVGRRGQKTRFAFVAAVAGHGPGWEEGQPELKGVLQGGDVVWIAQNYTNLSTVLWREEIVPRMGHLPWVKLNIQKHDVEIDGLGALMLRSGDREAIDSIRGIGKRLYGVIVDEAAWLDLRGALQDVILLALADNDGWLIIMSTTNAGPDGGYDDTGAPQVPSYFNVLCEEIRGGQRSDEWVEFVGTAYDNPTLSRKAIDDLIAEYPPDSPKLKQEVFAELLKGGIGLALPDLDQRHIVDRFHIPDYWEHFASFDWGYNHPYAFCWFTVDSDGTVFLVDTITGIHQTPDLIAKTVAAAVPLEKMRWIAAGHDCWADLKARGETGPTVAEQLYAHGWKRLGRANISRVSGLNNLRDYVAIRGTDKPRFRICHTTNNLKALAQLQAMQVDPKKIEDALKVDADHAGRGGDDIYDAIRYGLMSRPIKTKMAAKYDHSGSEPHKDTNLRYVTKDGKPPVWIGPEDQDDKLNQGFAAEYPVNL